MVSTTPRHDHLASPPRVLVVACFFSNLDRFAVSPLLAAIAHATRVPLAHVTLVASGYALAYGLAQVGWGLLSDRFGRVLVLRIAALSAMVVGLASAVTPTLTSLIVARTITGACMAAIVPISLTYVGDTVPQARRQRALSDLMGGMGLGIAVATLFAGAAVDWLSWRLVFAVPAIAVGVMTLGLRNLPEPPRAPQRPGGQLDVLRSGWLWVAAGLAFIEGAVLLSGVTYLSPALQRHGMNAAVAGACAAAYGLGVLAFTRVVKPISVRWPAWALLLTGGALLTVGCAVAASHQSAATVVVAALALGGAWAFIHSTLQTWATAVVPQARGTAVASFATALFVGSAAGTAAVASLAGVGRFGLLYGLGAVIAVPFAVVAATARAQWRVA